MERLEAKLIAKGGVPDLTPLMTRLFPKTAKAGGHLERYPARVFLCAYMVLSHPQVVFNSQGELEDMLAAAGNTMIAAFEALLEHLAEPMQVTARSGPLPSLTCMKVVLVVAQGLVTDCFHRFSGCTEVDKTSSLCLFCGIERKLGCVICCVRLYCCCTLQWHAAFAGCELHGVILSS